MLALVLLPACGGSASEQAHKLSQKIQSWEATGQLTDELRNKGAIPAEYVRQIREAVAQELEKTRRSAEKLSQ